MQDAGGHCPPVVGGGAHVVDRLDLVPQRVRRACRPSRLVGAAPSRAASVRGARIGVAATEPSASRTSRHVALGPGCQASAMTTLEIACARRVPTLRKRTDVAGQREADAQEQLVRRERRLPVGRPEFGGRHDALAGARCPSTSSASAASRIGSVSPAGEALTTLPPIVPAVLDLGRADGGRRLRQRRQELGDARRSADLGVGRQRADHAARRRRPGCRAARRAARGPGRAPAAHRARR